MLLPTVYLTRLKSWQPEQLWLKFKPGQTMTMTSRLQSDVCLSSLTAEMLLHTWGSNVGESCKCILKPTDGEVLFTVRNGVLAKNKFSASIFRLLKGWMKGWANKEVSNWQGILKSTPLLCFYGFIFILKLYKREGSAHKARKGTVDPLELGLQAVVNHWTWVLKIRLMASGRATPNCWAVSPAVLHPHPIPL